MIIERVELRNFRNYERAAVDLSPEINLLVGANGAGKTNLLEAIYTGSTGRSCRTNTDSRVVRFGEPVARVVLTGHADQQSHTIAVGIERGSQKVITVDDGAVTSLDDVAIRPLVVVFMPDRLELVKGAPGMRRSHLDQLVAALWPGRRANRSSYVQTLAQRNALLSRRSAAVQLDVWDAELARHGAALIADRDAAINAIADGFADYAETLGLGSGAVIAYRPCVADGSADELRQQLFERRTADLERGFTTFGPHREDFSLKLDRVDLRYYGSQGQQRVALLALLLAERDAIAEHRDQTPLTLLDDVMSELDAKRRGLLIERLRESGQCVITTTEAEHVPQADTNTLIIDVEDGAAVPRAAV